MNRLPKKAYNRDWYTHQGAAGDGIKDFYGKVYVIQRDGSLRRLTPKHNK